MYIWAVGASICRCATAGSWYRCHQYHAFAATVSQIVYILHHCDSLADLVRTGTILCQNACQSCILRWCPLFSKTTEPVSLQNLPDSLTGWL